MVGVIGGSNHWWQNWPKTHAFVAEKMFFPKTVDEIALAIQRAEADQRPLRAVGGGWSFSGAALPGNVTTNRPNARAVEAITAVLPEAERFPSDPSEPSVASITPMPSSGDPDGAGTMVMVFEQRLVPPVVDSKWGYLGSGKWEDLTNHTVHGVTDGPGFLDWLASKGWRPVRALGGLSLEEGDAAGSLMMLDLNEHPTAASREWFYKGNGVWMVGVASESAPDEGTLYDLSKAGRLTRPGGMNLSPRAADSANSVSVLLSKAPSTPAPPEPVYLLNTRSLLSSLQQKLPSILSAGTLDETSETPSTHKRRFLFHVEAGITIAELGQLLAHQSPRLSLQAISGSPGATLAGAMSTGTHGAEFNWPLLIDTVKAVHFVGPGGLQWWFEGTESITDPQKLRAAYPNIDPSRIIRGTGPVGGVVPADWLGAAVVSLGCLGVLYSVVLEVVPLYGVREVVVQKTWNNLGFLGSSLAGKDVPTLLRDPATASLASSRIVKLMQAGNLNGTQIPQVDGLGNIVNQYADLAINPIPRPDFDFDCWIANRQVTAELPLDPHPASGLAQGVAKAFDPDRTKKLGQLFGLSDVLSDPPTYGAELIDHIGWYKSMINRITRASDLVDVALDTLLKPMSNLQGSEVSQALLTGILSGLLNTANSDRRSDVTGVSVGNLGFPDSGVMGAALEIALAPTDAFGFIQTEILDKMGRNKPFYGYISIRLCSKTDTLMGMQQFGDATNPVSVMVEVVAFANDYAREFVGELQQRTADRIDKGLDAMLHWGLENDAITAKHLGATKALQAQSRSGMPKLSTFKAVRTLMHAAAPTTFHVFDNAFTQRLGLSSPATGLAFCDETGRRISEWVPTAWNVAQGTPLVEHHATYLQDLHLVNNSNRWVQVDSVRVVSSADAPGAPVFTVLSPQAPFQVPIRSFLPVLPLVVEYLGAPIGHLTGTILVECDRPIGPTLTIDLATSVTANRHAQLQVTPAALDFGTTSVGADVGEYLDLTNTGPYDAQIDGITVTLDQPPGQFAVPMLLPSSVNSGQSVRVYVSFTPTSRGHAQATLAIDTHSRTDISGVEDQRRYDVPLTGTAQAPVLVLSLRPRGGSATTLDFGSAPPSTLVERVFWIRNSGDAALVVQDVLVYDQTTFGITDASIFPATLQPREAMEVMCNFRAPAVSGFSAASLFHVRSNDPRQPQDPTVGDLIVKGRAAGPHFLNPPEVLMLGTDTGLTTSADLVFQSNGTDPVTVKSVKLADSNDFSVNGISPANPMPLQVDPGNELRVTVALTATQPGSYQSRLFVVHDGSPSGDSQVIVNGYVA